MSLQQPPAATTRSTTAQAPQMNLQQLFADHILQLERHARIMSQLAAEHFNAGPNTTIAHVCETMAMSQRAEEAVKDARRCQQMYNTASLPQMDGTAEQVPHQTPSRRKRASEDPPDLPYLGSAKRQRLCRPEVVQPLVQHEPRSNTVGSSEDSQESHEQDCERNSDAGHEDIREEVMARLEAAARRRQENDGLLQKTAVKRKRDPEDEDELDQFMEMFIDRLQEAQTEQRVRKRLRGFVEENRKARGES